MNARSRINEILVSFVVPTVILGTVFAVLTTWLHAQDDVWFGLYLSIAISGLFFLWSEIRNYRDDIANTFPGGESLTSYQSVMLRALQSVSDPGISEEDVFILKGYPQDGGMEGEFYSSIVTACNRGRIARLYRLIAISKPEHIDDALVSIRAISEAHELTRIKCYITYAYPSYFSFFAIRGKKAYIALADLTGSPAGIKGHLSAVSTEEPRVVQNIIDIFHGFLKDHNRAMEIPWPKPTENNNEYWTVVKQDILNRFSHYFSSP